MEHTQLESLVKTLDDIRHQNGVEFWYARKLYPLLGYARWENFETAIYRAKESCKTSGASIEDHFRDLTKMVGSALTKTGIYPESLPASEDIKKIEARHRKEMSALQKKQRKELDVASKKSSKT